MKKILGFLLFMGLGFFVNAQTVPRDELKLSPEQKVQVEKIQVETETELKSLLPLLKSDPDTFHKKRKEITATSDKSILALLGDSQRKTYNKIIEMRETIFSTQLAPAKKGGSQ